MRALVTRPEPQASAWAHDLQQAGIASHALPLIAISGPADPVPVGLLWHELATYRAVMFVSPAAVDWFMRQRPAQARWPAQTLAAAPGPGTAQRLQQTGAGIGLTTAQIISPAADADQFDSETLWPLLAHLPWQGQRVCIISGGDGQEAKGRTWLTAQWRQQGAQVHTLLTYQRQAAQWSPEQRQWAQQALAKPKEHVWLFSSSEALVFLRDHCLPLLGPTSTSTWSNLQALVTHPRIAERARELGVGHIIQTRPDLQEVVQALRSLRSDT